MNQELEQITFHYILKHPDLTEKCRSEFFSITYIGELFKIAKPFVMQYQTPPSAEQMVQLIQVSELSEELRMYLNPNIVRQIWKVEETLDTYDEEWLERTVKAFISWNTMTNGLRDALAYIKTVQGDVNIDNYEDIIDRARFKLTKDTAVEFSNNTAGVSLYDAAAHKTKELNRWSTGYKFLDRASKGGYWAGSLWVFLGAPKAGKSRLLQNLAAQSIKQGHNCAYASFELQEEIITQRIGSNLFSIPMDDYDRYADDEAVMNEKIRSFLNPPDDFFNIEKGYLDIKSFPTSAYSVQELELWLLKEEERLSLETGKPFKFKNIFVDYINIMKNWRNPNSENTYMKIKQIAEDLRAMAMRNGWCVITVTQVKQEFFGSSDMNMSAAAESSALSATVDFMGGIITDVFMQAAHFLFLKSILSRVSPNINERKKFLIQEEYMRITESDEDIIHDEDMIESFTEKAKNIVKNYKTQGGGAGKSKPIIKQTPTPQFTSESAAIGLNVNPSTPSTPIRPQLGLTEITGEGMF